MGNAERRFKDCVSRGDESKANECYNKQFKNNRKRVDPNAAVLLPTSPRGNGASLTLLQCCALHAMEHLYWELVNNGGNVLSVTSEEERICHLICTYYHDSNINARKSAIRSRMLSETIEKCFKNSPSQLMECIDAKDKVTFSLILSWLL